MHSEPGDSPASSTRTGSPNSSFALGLSEALSADRDPETWQKALIEAGGDENLAAVKYARARASCANTVAVASDVNSSLVGLTIFAWTVIGVIAIALTITITADNSEPTAANVGQVAAATQGPNAGMSEEMFGLFLQTLGVTNRGGEDLKEPWSACARLLNARRCVYGHADGCRETVYSVKELGSRTTEYGTEYTLLSWDPASEFDRRTYSCHVSRENDLISLRPVRL